MYTCALCNDSFLTLFGRIMHIQTVHGGAVPPTMIPVAPIKRHAVSLTKNSKIARKESRPLEPEVLEVLCKPIVTDVPSSQPEFDMAIPNTNELLSSQDDGWLYNAAEEMDEQDDAGLCDAADQFEQQFNQDAQLFDDVGLQDIINETNTM